MQRRAAILSAVVLAACSRGGDGKAAGSERQAEAGIRCALNGAAAFEPKCTRDIGQGPDGEVWIIRHPDGGFRRFVLIDKGTRIAAADGAEELQAERRGPDLEVRIAGNRYLFPAAPDAPAS